MNGYVYIMTNEAMPGLIKIGRTQKSPEERRRELSKPTSVPKEFVCEYEIYSNDIVALEKHTQTVLKNERYNRNREFFRADLSEAINIINKKAKELRLKSQLLTKGTNEIFEPYEAIEVLGRLHALYPGMIRSEIISVRVYQTSLRCYLEMTEEKIFNGEQSPPLLDIKIHRQDMAFICGDDYDIDRIDDSQHKCLAFDPSKGVSFNARVFLEEFDSYSKLMCFDLFTEEAGQVISKEHSRIHNIDENPF